MSFGSLVATAQLPINVGDYFQNFDSLGGTAALWTNNLTLLGWYASKGTADATNYLAGTGNSTAGGMYSFGTSGVGANADRALGSVAASSISYSFGVRFTNDTAVPQTNITISYTGEEWRSGSTVTSQILEFAYQVSSVPLTNSVSGSWTVFGALSFASPNLLALQAPLDGNASTNRQPINQVSLTGVTVAPGQELFLRWRDVDDSGFDNGLAIDDLTVSFNGVATPTVPSVTTQPSSQTVIAGDNVSFTVAAIGYPPPGYQWQFNGTNLAGATTTALELLEVTTNQSGNYSVLVTNTVGTTNSQAATLTVNAATVAPGAAAFSLLTYNIHGNGAPDWSTNAAQVRAIARQLQYLQPDIITFNEIPYDLSYEMTNFVAAFLPGYQLAINSGTDGFIRSAIASRYPITRSTSWLDGTDLKPFGYTNTSTANADNFTRDLFEAQINVPGLAFPLHVFTTHLKSSSSGYTDAAAKRAAEAAAITNFFATNLFLHYPNDPYTLSGDMNESDTTTLALQRLTSLPTDLRLTNPTNPVTHSLNTFSIQGSLSERIDYVMPCGLLFTNLIASQVFRTDLLNPLLPNLNGNDDQMASDHLPVILIFAKPYDQPFRLSAFSVSNQLVTLQWKTTVGRQYRVDSSTDLTTWSTLTGSLMATNTTFTWSTNLSDTQRFFRVYRLP